MDPVSIVLLASAVAVVALVLARAYAEINEAFVQEWARAHALELTPLNRPMVWWYLRNARVLRTLGVLGAIFVAPLVTASVGLSRADSATVAVDHFSFNPETMAWAFAGYLVGALYAEVSLLRPLPKGRRAASVERRELAQYLPRRVRRLQRAIAGCAIAALLAGMLLEPRSPATDDVPSDTTLAVLAGAALTIAIVIEGLQRWIVERPQPFTDADLIAADDAIRSQSVHSLAGSALAMLLLLGSVGSIALGLSDVQVLRWTMWVPAAFGWLAAIGACLWFGHRAWAVPRRGFRRPVPQP